jgi:hypothetical protein
VTLEDFSSGGRGCVEATIGLTFSPSHEAARCIPPERIRASARGPTSLTARWAANGSFKSRFEGILRVFKLNRVRRKFNDVVSSYASSKGCTASRNRDGVYFLGRHCGKHLPGLDFKLERSADGLQLLQRADVSPSAKELRVRPRPSNLARPPILTADTMCAFDKGLRLPRRGEKHEAFGSEYHHARGR